MVETAPDRALSRLDPLEEEVVRQRLAGVLVPDGAGRITDRSFSIEETFNLLPRLNPREAIYQTTIPVSVHFLRGYGLDPAVHRFAPCRPDLILMDDRGRLQVIDIKASEDLSTSHRIQATLYALILDHALASSASILVDRDHAAIWPTARPPLNPSTSTQHPLPRSSPPPSPGDSAARHPISPGTSPPAASPAGSTPTAAPRPNKPPPSR